MSLQSPTNDTTETFWGSKASVHCLLFGHAVFWLLVSGIFDIHPDMADHWVWSRYLTWGYFEHPPFVALTMRWATLFGSPIWGLKIGSVFFSVLILWSAYQVARSMVGEKAAWWFLLALEATPYFTLGSTFWHIDQPYMLFWLAGLWVLSQLVQSKNPKWMLAFGLVLGLGAESKYIMALLPLGFALFMLVNRQWLFLLKSPYTWAGALICFGLLAPNLHWNATHEWVTFSYNFKKGLTGGDPLRHFSLFTAGHLLLFSAVLAPAVWFRLFKSLPWRSQEKRGSSLSDGWPAEIYSMVLCTSLVPAVFFTAASFKGRGADPHWLNVTYFGLLLILANDWSRQASKMKLMGFAVAGNYLFVTLVMCLLFFNPMGADYRNTRPAKTLGWPTTAIQIEDQLQQSGLELPEYVISREYHLSGALSLYLPNHPWPHSLEKPVRNQWSPVEKVLQQGALIACPPKECPSVLGQVKVRFGQVPELLGTTQTESNGFVVRELELYTLKPVNR